MTQLIKRKSTTTKERIIYSNNQVGIVYESSQVDNNKGNKDQILFYMYNDDKEVDQK